MTTEQLQAKIAELLERDKAHVQGYIEKAIQCGCMDIEGADNNYLLAKNVLTAVYKEMSRQYAPIHPDKNQEKNINKISKILKS